MTEILSEEFAQSVEQTDLNSFVTMDIEEK